MLPLVFSPLTRLDDMQGRLKNLGFGSKRKSSTINVASPTQPAAPLAVPAQSQPAPQGGPPPPAGPNASTTTLPMNPNQLGRPPSYTYTQGSGQLGAPPAPAGRPISPTVPAASGLGHPPPSQVMNGPPPINTAAAGGAYSPQGTMGSMGPPPPAAGHPPGYAGGYGAPGGGGPTLGGGQFGGRGGAVEVEGAGRSKAQLIVGIDFVSASIHHAKKFLTGIGNHLFRCRFCLCYQHRSKGRHHHGMAWRRKPDEAKGTSTLSRLDLV